MAFAVHINLERCTGCGNCVVACPVNALELFTIDPVSKDKTRFGTEYRSASISRLNSVQAAVFVSKPAPTM
jgi:ferredoxin